MKYNLVFFLFLAMVVPWMSAADDGLRPAGAMIEAGVDSAVISWQVPPSPAFDRIILFRSTIPVEPYFSYEAVAKLCDQLYEGRDQAYIDSGLAPNLPYYYILFARARDGAYSQAVILERQALAPDRSQGPDSLAGLAGPAVNEVSLSEAGLVYNYNAASELDENSRRLSLFIIVRGPHDLTDRDKNAISYFIHSGTPTTIILGSGERAGVLNSYLSVFNKLPQSELEWQDVIKIGNGRWPDERNPDAEARAADTYFSQVYRRAPDIDNPNDNAAVTVIAYGLRPSSRNLDSEKAAILTFRAIFGQDPLAAADWDLVRAIAYSGATR